MVDKLGYINDYIKYLGSINDLVKILIKEIGYRKIVDLILLLEDMERKDVVEEF